LRSAQHPAITFWERRSLLAHRSSSTKITNGDLVVETLVRSHRFRQTIEEYRILQLIGNRVWEQGMLALQLLK
jgi:hypothetical protein